jgi:hypothetical protein
VDISIISAVIFNFCFHWKRDVRSRERGRLGCNTKRSLQLDGVDFQRSAICPVPDRMLL